MAAAAVGLRQWTIHTHVDTHWLSIALYSTHVQAFLLRLLVGLGMLAFVRRMVSRHT